ncbi:PASTA domain-containing protein [Catellatospora citrea]|uniref:PASTA domain-containing protein n=1 Tax=Catellatospora citrea TaxID=53366 RepID=UPI0033F347C6
MSDEQRHDDSDPAAGGSGSGASPDETAPMPAHRRDEGSGPGDEPTTVLPAGGSAGDEATTVLPSGGYSPDEPTTVLPGGGRTGDDATTVLPAGGPVAVPPGGEPTSVLPPVGARPVPPDERTSVLPAQDVWTGRAGVPARESGPMRGATPPPPGIEYGEGQRTWRAPLVIIGIALLLLALFAVAAWLALRGGGPAPVPSASPTPALTSAVPSSAAPSPSVSVSPSPAASTVAVPSDLVGMSQQEAIDALNAVGLNPRITLRTTDEGDPGTVVEVIPEGGSVVEAGETVTIVVASAPASPSPEPSPSAEASPSPDED